MKKLYLLKIGVNDMTFLMNLEYRTFWSVIIGVEI